MLQSEINDGHWQSSISCAIPLAANIAQRFLNGSQLTELLHSDDLFPGGYVPIEADLDGECQTRNRRIMVYICIYSLVIIVAQNTIEHRHTTGDSMFMLTLGFPNVFIKRD
ncbi:MAG: hypothetical protein GY878_14620 [Fuerstiella sp.]|nr:hypothetical protein [Fuerstiella sp.]